MQSLKASLPNTEEGGEEWRTDLERQMKYRQHSNTPRTYNHSMLSKGKMLIWVELLHLTTILSTEKEENCDTETNGGCERIFLSSTLLEIHL